VWPWKDANSKSVVSSYHHTLPYHSECYTPPLAALRSGGAVSSVRSLCVQRVRHDARRCDFTDLFGSVCKGGGVGEDVLDPGPRPTAELA
jgi:hypothetical protein